MQESKSSEKPKTEKSERDAEATSKETLAEIEDGDVTDSADSGESAVPSPDGSFDEPQQLGDADPM